MLDHPSEYQLRAALRVARLIDEMGNATRDARETYRYALTLGEHSPPQLEIGERLLIAAGLLEEHEQRLIPAGALHVLASVDDGTALDVLARELATRGLGTGEH